MPDSPRLTGHASNKHPNHLPTKIIKLIKPQLANWVFLQTKIINRMANKKKTVN
jgi:hypothetical protein